MNKNMLIFSLALNGYDKLYKEYLTSQKRYAQKLGADYEVVTKPGITLLARECCWLKLYLMRRALEAGYQWVLFLDADCHVRDSAPDIRQVHKPGKSIYMANGFSGRHNSGVILLSNHADSKVFLDTVLVNKDIELPDCDQVGWGENGHVIHFARHNPMVETISHRWNNTWENNNNDYIRHTNCGPLRQGKWAGLFHTLIRKTSKVLSGLHRMPIGKERFVDHQLRVCLNRISARYPVFSR